MVVNKSLQEILTTQREDLLKQLKPITDSIRVIDDALSALNDLKPNANQLSVVASIKKVQHKSNKGRAGLVAKAIKELMQYGGSFSTKEIIKAVPKPSGVSAKLHAKRVRWCISNYINMPSDKKAITLYRTSKKGFYTMVK